MNNFQSPGNQSRKLSNRRILRKTRQWRVWPISFLLTVSGLSFFKVRQVSCQPGLVASYNGYCRNIILGIIPIIRLDINALFFAWPSLSYSLLA